MRSCHVTERFPHWIFSTLYASAFRDFASLRLFPFSERSVGRLSSHCEAHSALSLMHRESPLVALFMRQVSVRAPLFSVINCRTSQAEGLQEPGESGGEELWCGQLGASRRVGARSLQALERSRVPRSCACRR